MAKTSGGAAFPTGILLLSDVSSLRLKNFISVQLEYVSMMSYAQPSIVYCSTLRFVKA